MAKSKAVSIAITANSTSIRSEVEKVNKTLDTLGHSAKKAAHDVGVLKHLEFAHIGLEGLHLGGELIMGIGEKIFSMAERITESTKRISDMSKKTGIGVEALQGYGLASKLAGVDVETFAKMINKMEANIGKATVGGGFSDGLKEIGISLADLRALSPEKQFDAISTAIGELPTYAERAAAAVRIFGKAGAELIPVFLEGEHHLGALFDRAQALGIILSDKQVSNIAGMDDGFKMVSATIDGIVGQVLGDLAPAVSNVLEGMLKFVEAQKGANGAVGGAALAQSISDGIISGARYFLQGVQSLEKVFLDFLVSLGSIGLATLSPQQTELVNARAQNNTEGVRQARNRGNDSQGLVADAEKRLAAAEAAIGSMGVQVAIDFLDNFANGIKESRKAASAVETMVAALPVGIGDTPEAKASRKAQMAADIKAATESATAVAKAVAKAQEDATSRVQGLQPKDEKARVTFLKDIAAVNVTIAAAETAAAAARKAGDADGIKAAEERLSLVYEQAGVAVQIANQNRKEKEMAVLKTRSDLTKQADEINNTLRFDLASPSRAALVANDVRTSAGASQVSSFRRMEDDPALDEARAATKKLEEIKQKLDALNREPVDML